MHKLQIQIKLLLLVVYCFIIGTVAANEKLLVISTEANKMVEVTLTAKQHYADPFNEVILDAIFTLPSGAKVTVPAFWAGGQTWKVRYSSSLPGDHNFQTVCSVPADKGLQGIHGKVVVKKYAGQNLLYLHGPLKIASDNRHLAYRDETPFFWMGDTWWMGLTKRLVWPEDVEQLAANRLQKGFNVIQIIAGLYPDMQAFDDRGRNEAGFPWDTAYKAIRPEYFNEADKRIIYLADQGLVPCIVGAWGYHLPWMGTEKMKQHWRYIIARWGALPVVWCAAGETTMPFYLSKTEEADAVLQKAEWTKVIRFMRDTDPFHRLITTHPSSSARASLSEPELLDFEMNQSGHDNVTSKQAAQGLANWRMLPTMPVLSGESRYEALEIPFPLPAEAPRQAFWAHSINSGFAGHTYGANGIWQLNGRDKPYGNSPWGGTWGNTPWNIAMNLPGSKQVGAGRKLIESLPNWNHFEPRPESVISWSGKDTAFFAIAGNETALAYLPAPGTVQLQLPLANAQYTACWFDPVDCKKLGDFSITTDPEGKYTATSPTGLQDWVLTFRK